MAMGSLSVSRLQENCKCRIADASGLASVPRAELRPPDGGLLFHSGAALALAQLPHDGNSFRQKRHETVEFHTAGGEGHAMVPRGPFHIVYVAAEEARRNRAQKLRVIEKAEV